MLAPTHLIAGQAAYLGTALAVGHAPTPLEGWIAAAAALVPDLDSRQSIVGRLFPWLSEPIEYRFGHRTMTHSLLVCVALGLALWWVLPFGLWLALITGYASHPIADWMTPSGTEWLWPARWRCVLPGNPALRMQAMGWGELIFAGLLTMLSMPLAVLGTSAPVTGGVISAAMGDIGHARERYDAEKGSDTWAVEIAGRDNRGYRDVSGRYGVVGEYGANGFLLKAGGEVVSLCRNPGCDWYADKVVLHRGEPQITTSRRLTVSRSSTKALQAHLTPLMEVGTVYLIGSLRGPGIDDSPPLVSVSGDRVQLHYATLRMLRSWPHRVLRDVDLMVQVRHPPGVEAPVIPPLPVFDEAQWPETLERWIQ